MIDYYLTPTQSIEFILFMLFALCSSFLFFFLD
jgi:hypothetical protein